MVPAGIRDAFQHGLKGERRTGRAGGLGLGCPWAIQGQGCESGASGCGDAGKEGAG